MNIKGRTGRRLALGLLVIGGLAIAAAAGAKPGGGRGHGHGLKGLEHSLERLELAPGVESSVSAILDAARADHEALRSEIREAKEQMWSLMAQDAPDEAAVLAQAETVGALMTEARKARILTMLQVRAQLTPEQRAALDAERGEKRGRRHGCQEKSEQ